MTIPSKDVEKCIYSDTTSENKLIFLINVFTDFRAKKKKQKG